MQKEISDILTENKKRIDSFFAPFDPITGEGSTGKRKRVVIADLGVLYLPVDMLKEKIIKELIKHGVSGLAKKLSGSVSHASACDSIIEAYIRVRIRYDFPFWAAMFVKIKPKGGGDHVPFILRPAQRKLVDEGFQNTAVLSEPIRLIILKARQWGGSTCTQLFFAWLQLVHSVGLNSLICAQVKDTALEIMDMFQVAISEYPTKLLHGMTDAYNDAEPKWTGMLNAQNIHRVPQRKCKIKVGSAEKPDSCRGGDYNLIHCSEVGVWKTTEGKKPEDIVDSAQGGMGLDPLTMVVYESTAKGSGNFFHREWVAATSYDEHGERKSQFRGLFIPWYEITDRYSLPFSDDDERESFARTLYNNRNKTYASSDRAEPGDYLWRLWEAGACLEAIHWYVQERKKYNDHGHMASEYPTDDIEAFVHSGVNVFNKYDVDKFKAACKAPKWMGDITGDAIKGKQALQNLKFSRSDNGAVWIWEHPETFDDGRVLYRYLVTVDIGGRSRNADWSVISVLDRYDMMEGGKPAIVAQWRGHIDHDLLAWKSAQIAAYYDNALLVIESNTLETKDKERQVDGDQSGYILNQIKECYDNLYARSNADEASIAEGKETVFGFHTNVKTKVEIISNLIEVVREHLYVERDIQCLNEYNTYELTDNGVYQAIQGNHDDLLMTRAIGLWICYRVMDRPRFVDANTKYIVYNKSTFV